MTELCEQGSLRAALNVCSRSLERLPAAERVRWALDTLPGNHIVSSSFGAQAAVMLHLMASQRPDIPVVVIDTGYLFPETYRFVDSLTARLDLNLKVFRPAHSSAWQEARFGKRWEQGVSGIDAYNRDNKIERLDKPWVSSVIPKAAPDGSLRSLPASRHHEAGRCGASLRLPV